MFVESAAFGRRFRCLAAVVQGSRIATAQREPQIAWRALD
jgi:hypothetical protein